MIQEHISQENYLYSVPVGPKKKGETQAYRHPASKDQLLVIPSHLKNLGCFWDETVSKHSRNLALEEMTYKDADMLARSLGSWLFENGHKKIYLFAKNSLQWTLTDIACWNYGITNVPLYDTLGA